MGRQKKYDIRSINFGTPENPARILITKFVSLNGKTALSPFIRKLIIIYLSDKQEYNECKKEVIISEKREISREINLKIKRIHILDERLEKMGIKPEDTWSEKEGV